MINIELLKQEMTDKNFNISKLSKESKIDKSVLSRIINGESKTCTVETAQNISEALDLSSKKRVSIFFAKQIAETQHVWLGKRERELN